MATQLHGLIRALPGVDVGDPPEVNSLFPRLPAAMIEPLRRWCFFWDWDVSVNQVRWMTAWDTTQSDVERFAAGVGAMSAAVSAGTFESL
jgi:threonine aldolase